MEKGLRMDDKGEREEGKWKEGRKLVERKVREGGMGGNCKNVRQGKDEGRVLEKWKRREGKGRLENSKGGRGRKGGNWRNGN